MMIARQLDFASRPQVLERITPLGGGQAHVRDVRGKETLWSQRMLMTQP